MLESFVQPCCFDEALTVHVALAAATRAMFQMSYLVVVDGQARTSGVTVYGCTNLEG